MKPITVEELLDCGVHFGHRGSRWNPKMKPYIFMKGNLIHIIDLRKTVRGLFVATNFLKKMCSKGGDVLFVGTKRQASSIVQAEAKRCGMHYVNTRWLGGTLTNFDVIRRRLRRLDELEELEASPRINLLSKKIQSSMGREMGKMKKNLDGIRTMKKLPSVMVVIDPKHEHNAVAEAKKLSIPSICLLDTDADPEMTDIPIPANDDAMRAVQVLLSRLTDSIIEGVEIYKAQVGPVAEDESGRGGTRAPQRRRPTDAGRRKGFETRAPAAARPAKEPEAHAAPPENAEAAPVAANIAPVEKPAEKAAGESQKS